jgi:putative DNA methylase
MVNCLHKGWHARGYLPHFDAGAVVQTITFRLADSMPRALYDEIAAAALALDDLRVRADAAMDEGHGSCVLAQQNIAAIVQSALEHFDGERYRLIAWVIMPNHVHAMIEQMPGRRLGDIVHSWKSFTANRINKVIGKAGEVWAADYFDRYIRDDAHYASALHYIENNPVKAGLVRHAAEWEYSSAAERG